MLLITTVLVGAAIPRPVLYTSSLKTDSERSFGPFPLYGPLIEFRAYLIRVTENDQSQTFDQTFNLWDSINVEKSSFKCTPSKIEIKVRKSDGIRWEKLEKDITAASSSDDADDKAHEYPTSSTKGHKDWDKIEKQAIKDEEDEKLEGDAAVNKLFQQIFKDANDDTRRAMIKSFQESNGTCLSTNWDEVGKEEVECKPPDGMEWKQY